MIGQADVVLGMELSDYLGHRECLDRQRRPRPSAFNEFRIKADTKLISITSVDLLTKANYQDFQRFQVVDVHMAADAEATLPALIEAVKSAIPAEPQGRDREARRGVAQGRSGSARAQPGGDGDRLGREPRSAPRG